jgi:leucyl/phenylalanyl-tRNA--protein transferase
MTRRLIVLLLPLIAGPCLAFATCESVLHTEFSRAPDDTDSGMVTDQIPMDVESLTAGYARGLFPWGVGVWFSPPERGVLMLSEVIIPRGDRKAIRKVLESGKYRLKIDTAFREVITECALQTRETGRWISDEHIEQFIRLHEAGFAHSVEVWEGDELVGGLYGVFVNGYFSGESMFHKANDVTKLAYSYLIDRLKANGHVFIDTQQTVGLNEKWGGRLISRAEFKRLLAKAKTANRPF